MVELRIKSMPVVARHTFRTPLRNGGVPQIRSRSGRLLHFAEAAARLSDGRRQHKPAEGKPTSERSDRRACLPAQGGAPPRGGRTAWSSTTGCSSCASRRRPSKTTPAGAATCAASCRAGPRQAGHAYYTQNQSDAHANAENMEQLTVRTQDSCVSTFPADTLKEASR